MKNAKRARPFKIGRRVAEPALSNRLAADHAENKETNAAQVLNICLLCQPIVAGKHIHGMTQGDQELLRKPQDVEVIRVPTSD